MSSIKFIDSNEGKPIFLYKIYIFIKDRDVDQTKIKKN
jgi:hypothetical protein